MLPGTPHDMLRQSLITLQQQLPERNDRCVTEYDGERGVY